MAKKTVRTKKTLKVALAHDYLREYGGAERVLEALHEMYPNAPVFTAFVDADNMGAHWSRFSGWDIRESWLTKIPFYKKIYSPLRIIADKCFRSFDLAEYDVVISSSNAYFAKAVQVPNGVHICYCHTPPRSLYGYNAVSNWKKNLLTRFLGTILNHFVRVIDYYVSQDVDVFVTNSHETQRRITAFYRRESQVIYPPVGMVDAVHDEKLDVQREYEARTEDYYLYVNRLALAKHPELAVETCKKLGVPLKVVGAGPMEQQLKELAAGAENIEFLGAVSDQKLRHLYTQAAALLYPVEDEDFGIVPIEAMAHGCPVLAHASGGPLETVHDFRLAGKRGQPATGVLFQDLSTHGLAEALAMITTYDFDRTAISASTTKYSTAQFSQKIEDAVQRAYTTRFSTASK